MFTNPTKFIEIICKSRNQLSDNLINLIIPLAPKESWISLEDFFGAAIYIQLMISKSQQGEETMKSSLVV